MHFVSISTLAVALASSAMAANTKFDVTPVEEGVQGIIKSNDGETCLDNYGAQSKTGECGLFQSVGKGGLWSPKGFLAFNGENITIASGQPEYTWEGVELPSQIGTTVYGLAVYKDGEIVEGPGWSPVLGKTFSSPREDFVTEHLMFYQSPDGKYW